MYTVRTTLLTAFLVLTPSTGTSQEVQPYLLPPGAREALVDLKATVHHGLAGREYTAELTESEVGALRARGFDPRPVAADPAATAAAMAWTSYAQMRADFVAYAVGNPSIAQFRVIGRSVQGRDLFGLRISDNVGLEENEPEVVFWASIHGDEFASGEVAYHWAMDLVDAYGVDPVATGYVDSSEIWVIPLLNPDGHEAGRRSNINGVDLNRDCGWQWDGWGRSPAPNSQPETQALLEFCQANNVTLSVTMHCSGNVFLYPWGYTRANAQEVALIQQVGSLYSTAAGYQLQNSWVSYETHGEVLDTLYGSFGGLCYTAELSNSMSLYANTYSRNQAGMNSFCAVAGTGLHGLVTDAGTGQPLRAAVFVSGSPIPAYTDPTVGDVHRMVLDGSHDVTVWANGYEPQTVRGIRVSSGASAPFQVALKRGGNEHGFSITAVNQRDPNNRYNNRTPPSHALGAPDGRACSLGLRGSIVLDLGAGHAITDGPGVDFTVTEALVPDDRLLERYRVFGGNSYNPTALVGVGVGTASFDLAVAGATSIRYLRIVDDSQSSANSPLAGMELDAVTVLNGVMAQSLSANASQVSLSTGGTQTYSLVGPTPNALYLMLGTTSGASPGLVLPNSFLTLPLNADAYYYATATSPNSFIQNSLGSLDSGGLATASLTLPRLSSSLAGLQLEHAFVLIDAAARATTFVSNTVPLTLVR